MGPGRWRFPAAQGQGRAAPRCEPAAGTDEEARPDPIAASFSVRNGGRRRHRLATGIVTPATGITWGGGGAAARLLPPSLTRAAPCSSSGPARGCWRETPAAAVGEGWGGKKRGPRAGAVRGTGGRERRDSPERVEGAGSQ